MAEFQQQFGQRNSNGDGGYHFSNVRSGLIVALLSVGTLMGALIAGPSRIELGGNGQFVPGVSCFTLV
jgi:SP family sugar:H+ symporter-like MFS transporter